MRIILSTLLILSLTSCFRINAEYNLSLDKVSSQFKTISMSEKEITVSKDKSNSFNFEDANIAIEWFPRLKTFDFRLKNKRANAIKIIWDSSAISDFYGTTHKVLHKNTMSLNINSRSSPEVLIKDSILESFVYPMTYAKHASGSNEYTYSELFLSDISSVKDAKNTINNTYLNKNVKILLPIEIDGAVIDYLFEFKIGKVTFK